MRSKLKLPPQTAVASMVLNLAEQTNIIYEEVASYTRYEFLADVGGSAGLFLGLSLLTILQSFCRLVKFTYDLIGQIKDAIRNKRHHLIEKSTSIG